MEMLSSFIEGPNSGYVRGGAILDTNDSDAESDASGQGVFDYSADVVSVASRKYWATRSSVRSYRTLTHSLPSSWESEWFDV